VSVINDMLRDLEQRKAPERESIAPVDVTQLIEPRQKNSQTYLIILAIVICIGAVFGTGLFQKLIGPMFERSIDVPAEISTSENLAVEPASESKKILHPVMSDALSETEETIVPTLSNRIQEETQELLVKEQTEAVPMADEEESRVEISVSPKQTTGSSVSESHSEVEVVANIVKVETVKNESVQVAVVEQKEVVELREEAKRKIEAEPVEKHIVLSPEAKDQQNAEMALKFFEAGHARKAYRQLYDFIAENETDLKSRSVLAGYLLQDGRVAEAGDVLVRAPIELDADLRQIKARWLLATGDETMALHTLSSNLPELEAYPDYFALLASYYQQFGYPEKAAEVYSMLVQYDAGAASWWAGLGLALDSSERFNDAVKAYRRALQLPGLNRPVIEFINTRVQAINPK